jgi:hypothetical protein
VTATARRWRRGERARGRAVSAAAAARPRPARERASHGQWARGQDLPARSELQGYESSVWQQQSNGQPLGPKERVGERALFAR